MDHLHRGAVRSVAQVYVFGTNEEFHLPTITRRAQRRCVGDFAQLRGDAGRLHFTLEKMSQPDELSDKTRAWVPHDLIWRGILRHLALVDERQSIGEAQRFFLIVSHQDSGDVSLLENSLDFFAQLPPEMHVEVTKRLIKEEQLRSWSQGACQGH